ncbi:L-threonylcarbamoyladenylate synthase [Actinotalea sp. Marseille-Q4924]|uniref:L-threonylcarbamoyladenylate synthase n=1 Tax=Actinotalea sp. Marseille-Q4924 TaxID=2866571 RepID=UPI001CE3C6F6|nr:L-threonylcarbamoyladenylate synthase [Actinotalea sp. Marseille-Q4924]
MDSRDAGSWGPGLDEAVNVLRRGGLVVVPTDTVYGLAAEAFTPLAVAALRDATGRPAGVPPAVLVPDQRTVDGLCADVPAPARALLEAFWPGALTLVLHAQPSLAWDLGDDGRTVAVRMPDHPAALALLRRTGPLAVTGAHRTGTPASGRLDDALDVGAAQLALDAGELAGGEPSTVVDATGPVPRLLRAGAVGLDALRRVTPVLDLDGAGGGDAGHAADAGEAGDAPGTDAPAPDRVEPAS